MNTYSLSIILTEERDIERFRETKIYSETKGFAESAISDGLEEGFPIRLETGFAFGLLFVMSEINDLLDHGLIVMLQKNEEES